MGFPRRLHDEQWGLMAWIFSTSEKTDKVFEHFIPAETLPAWIERDRDEMMGENESEGRDMEAEAREGGSSWGTQRAEHRVTED